MNRIVHRGFTLIELMITVVILSILAAIAYPSYMHWTTVTRRSDAEIALTQLAAQEEKFFANCNWYASQFGTTVTTNVATNCGGNSAGGILPVGNASPDGYYTLFITVPNPSNPNNPSYELIAKPVGTGPQASDSQCTSFSIDETGAEAATGTATDCWKK